MRSVVLLTLGAFAGCAKVEEPDFPPASFNAVTDMDGIGFSVVGSQFSMHFAGGNEAAMHFPDNLAFVTDGVEGPNLLGPTEGCTEEQAVGLAMFPAFVTAPATSQESSLAIPQDSNLNSVGLNTVGHVVQVGIRYAVDYTCGGNERFAGNTTFTLFPTGRIVRRDFDLRPSTNPVMAASQPCGCSLAAGLLKFTTFWTFAATDGGISNSNDTAISLSQNAEQPGPFDGLCSTYPSHTIGVHFDGETSRVRRNTNNFAHVFDFNDDDTLVVPVVMDGDPPVLYETSSSIQLVDHAEDCSTVLASLATPGIEVDGQPIARPDADGIYTDFTAHEDDFDIRAGVSTVPAGWALRAEIPGGAARITKDPPFDDDRPVALVQRDNLEANVFIFYFPDALAPGETISFEVL